VNQQSQSLSSARSRRCAVYRMVLTAMFACLAFVLNTFVYFPAAIASYPLMKWFYGLDAGSPYYYIPFYTPSAVMGAAMGVAVLLILRRAGVFSLMLQELNQ